MGLLAKALMSAGMEPSEAVARELAREEECVPDCTFSPDFDLAKIIAGIGGPTDTRLYVENGDPCAVLDFVTKYLKANPDLGSMVASIPDIIYVDVQHDIHNIRRVWVAVLARNANTAWGITVALRQLIDWPAQIGKITCPKVEALFHRDR